MKKAKSKIAYNFLCKKKNQENICADVHFCRERKKLETNEVSYLQG